MRLYEYNPDFPGVMSYHLVPIFARLVTMSISVKEKCAIRFIIFSYFIVVIIFFFFSLLTTKVNNAICQ